MYIVSMASNTKKCIEAVGSENTKPRGTQLKDFIDDILKTAQKAVTQADFKHAFEKEETLTEGISDESEFEDEKAAYDFKSEPVLPLSEEIGA